MLLVLLFAFVRAELLIVVFTLLSFLSFEFSLEILCCVVVVITTEEEDAQVWTEIQKLQTSSSGVALRAMLQQHAADFKNAVSTLSQEQQVTV